MTWSVVRGSNKGDLEIDRTIGVVTHALHPGQETICAAVREFLLLVKSVVEMQRKSGVQYPVPVVYGSSVEIRSQDLVAGLTQSFRAQLGKFAVVSDPAFVRHMAGQSPGTPEHVLHKELLKIVLKALMENVTPPGSMQYEIRDYACAAGAQDWDTPPGAVLLTGQDAQERTRLAQSIIPGALRGRFDMTYAAFLQGRQEVRAELENIVREIAHLYARFGMLSREDGKVINRFVSAATTPDLTANSDVRNFIFLDMGLRRVYAEAFMAHHGISHNMCFKTALDKPSAPFADIAGTLLADLFDQRDGTSPTAVLVR